MRVPGGEVDADVAAPCVANPVHRLGEPQPVERLFSGGRRTSSKVKSRCTASLLPCDGPSIAYTVRCLRQLIDEWAPGPRIDEQAVPQHNRRSGAGASNVQPTEIGADEIRTRLIIANSPFTSETETSVTVVFSIAWQRQEISPPDRLAIGQLLVRLLREFRDDLAAPRAERATETFASRTSRSSAISGWAASGSPSWPTARS